jgi:N-acetylglucosaminyldiphosphoundecaprenol N-acetyl-beta-D-mannosaminyltransferase
VTRVDVLGVGFDPVDVDAAVEAAVAIAGEPGAHLIVTANVELVMRAREAHDLQDLLRRAALVVADGIGVVWGARYLGRALPGRVPGIDLAERLCGEAARRGWGVCLLGGAPGVAAEAASNVRRRYPEIHITAALQGYFGEEEEGDVLRTLRAASPALLLAGLGSPRQERWLDRHLASLGARIGLGVGGALDVWAGRVRRAPRAVQAVGLEWCYRLLRQPGRLPRQLAIPRFVAAVLIARARMPKR